MIRREACSACPYRRDVQSGVWSPEDYAKLPPYDAETFAQPAQAFACHATPEHLCHGWAVVGGWDLLGLRMYSIVTGEDVGEIPEPSVPLWPSHTAAFVHGMDRIADPDEDARATQERLLRKHERLR